MAKPNDTPAADKGDAVPLPWLIASLRARRGVLTSLVILTGLGFLANATWQAVRPQVAHSERYLVTPASLTVPPPPPWVRGDVVAEAFQRGALTGKLSVLDPPELLEEKLAAGLAAHPWVRRVGTIQKQPPNRLLAEIEYRTPLATVMSRSARTPTDVDGVALPTDTLSSDYLKRLPRIGVASGKPQRLSALPFRTGSWPTTEIAGAAALVAGFGPMFGEFDLFEVQIDPVPGVSPNGRYTNYQFRSRGNTIVVWGAAPGFEPPGESSFATKLQRLRAAIQRYGRLNSVAVGPALIDVREGINAFPRVVMKEGNRLAAKPDEEEAAVVK